MRFLAVRAAERALWNLYDKHQWENWMEMLDYLRGASRFCGSVNFAAVLFKGRCEDPVGTRILSNLAADCWNTVTDRRAPDGSESIGEPKKKLSKKIPVKKPITQTSIKKLALPLSGCCNKQIIAKIQKWRKEEVFYCSQCNKEINFALDNTDFRVGVEAPGVFEDFNGDYWFAWQQDSSVRHIQESVASGWKIVCQVKKCADTVGLRYNTQDTDMLSENKHRQFIEEWSGRVKNGERRMVRA